MSQNNLANGFAAYKSDHAHYSIAQPQYRVITSWFPVFTCILTLMSFIAGYIIAVKNDDEEPWFSYISDGGTISPESCIFGVLLNFAVFFWLLTATAWHIQLTQYMNFHHMYGCGWATARWTLYIAGIISGLGVSVVANFQETNVPAAHGFGAWFGFFGGLFYVWLFIIISVIIKPKFAPNILTFARGVLAMISTVALVMHMVAIEAAPFVKEDANGFKPPKPTAAPHYVVRLTPDDPWYVNHLVATIAEWILGVTFEIFVLTFAYELNTMKITALKDDQLIEVVDSPELTNVKILDSTVGPLHTPWTTI
ncbi:hypothetical protein M3Y94_00292200 [Aphelenchoides besseyi]|nr:hypothetical protein M3Y94_00292200 [Aphelenchoides besseyi]KAI6235893.1 DNA damage-regulated autophagy modulator protein 1 [Aphelenchoides besseyi]